MTNGVENIGIDGDADQEAVFYNLNGVRMPDANNLQPGIYVKVVGKTASKVVIR